jgi:hypothetical protein
MRLWREKGGNEPPLPDLAFLTRTQARRVRNLFRQAMAERGRELVTDSLGNFRDDEGNYYGLWNIAVLCRDDPGGENGWPELIAGYADTVLKGHSRAARADVAALTPEQARGLVYLSVRSAASLGPAAAGFGSAPELVPGLLQLLALDMPHTTVPLVDEEVARLGGQESLREAALANLRALPVPAHRRMGGPEAHFEAIIDDSHFTASRAIVMPDLLSRVLGTNAPHGALVGLPARHYLLIHVLADSTAGPSLLKMATMTRITHRRERGPISPDVLWWRDGGWMPVPSDMSDGKRILRPGPELSFLLTDLATQPPRG